jgi:hypothetical protein
MGMFITKMMNFSYFASVMPPSDVTAANATSEPADVWQDRMRIWTDGKILARLTDRILEAPIISASGTAVDEFGYDVDDVHDGINDVVSHVFVHFVHADGLKAQIDFPRLISAATDFPSSWDPANESIDSSSGADHSKKIWQRRYLAVLPILDYYTQHDHTFEQIGQRDAAFAKVLQYGTMDGDELQMKRVGRFRVATAEFVAGLVERFPAESMSVFPLSIRASMDLFFRFDKCSILHGYCSSLIRNMVSKANDVPAFLFGSDQLLDRFTKEYEPNSGRGNMGHMTGLLNYINAMIGSKSISLPEDFLENTWKPFVEQKLSVQNVKQEGTLGGYVPPSGRPGITGGAALNSVSALASLMGVGSGSLASAMQPMEIDSVEQDDEMHDEDEIPQSVYRRSTGEDLNQALRAFLGNSNSQAARAGEGNNNNSLAAAAAKDHESSDSGSDSDDSDDGLNSVSQPTSNATGAPVASDSFGSEDSSEEGWASF